MKLFQRCGCISTIATLISIVICLLWLLSPSLFSTILKNALVLEDGSSLFYLWKTNLHEMRQNFYFFNITNPTEVKLGKPINFDEIGPLSYKLHLNKSNFQWGQDHILSFTKNKSLKFLPESSEVSENTEIYVLNITAIENSWNMANNEIIVKKTLKQIMEMDFDFKSSSTFVPFKPIWKNKIDNFTLYTGWNNLSLVNVIHKWNQNILFDAKSDNSKELFIGTGIGLQPPLRQFQMTLSYFDSNLCDFLNFVFAEMDDVEGYSTRRFDLSYQANGFLSNNSNYLGNISEIQNCPHYPITLSIPHFLRDNSSKDPDSNPIESDQSSSVYIEPNTGIAINFTFRYQYNIHMDSNKAEFLNISNVYPLFWVETTGNVTDESKTFLFYYVKIPHFILYSAISWLAFLIIGSVIISIPILMFTKSDDNEELDPLLGRSRRVSSSYSNNLLQDSIKLPCSSENTNEER